MKSLNIYINEKFQVSKDSIRQYAYTPKDKDELVNIIQDKIKKEGLGTKDKPLDLNDIDTSKITDMGHLFGGRYFLSNLRELSENGYFDIFDWDVSNVTNMFMMFAHSNFDGDLSDWDVSNVEDMSSMFAKSSFNGDIHNWDVRNVKTMEGMFSNSNFNGNINSWKVNTDTKMLWMFDGCPLEKNPPKWYHV